MFTTSNAIHVNVLLFLNFNSGHTYIFSNELNSHYITKTLETSSSNPYRKC